MKFLLLPVIFTSLYLGGLSMTGIIDYDEEVVCLGFPEININFARSI